MATGTAAVLGQYIAANILKQPRRVLDEQTVLLTSGLVDSFSLVDLAMFVEETFAVQLADTELNSQTFNTLGELAQLVDTRR